MVAAYAEALEGAEQWKKRMLERDEGNVEHRLALGLKGATQRSLGSAAYHRVFVPRISMRETRGPRREEEEGGGM
jgi:hypothetical protein